MTKKQSSSELIDSESWRQLFDSNETQLAELVELAESEEEKVAERAKLVLSGLKKPESRSELCQIALSKERHWLDELLSTTIYLPDKQELQAPFLVITKQWNKYLHTFGKHGHRDLLNSLASGGEITERILAQIERTNDPACVKFILDLYLDPSSKGSTYKSRAGTMNSLEARLKAVLIDLKSESCRQHVFEQWLLTREYRLEQIIKEYDWLPSKPIELYHYAYLKFGSLLKLSSASKKAKKEHRFLKDDIDLLLNACRDRDIDIAKFAAIAVAELQDKEAQDEVLNRLLGKTEDAKAIDADGQPEALDRKIVLLEKLAGSFKYHPAEEKDLVLFHLLVRNWDAFFNADPESKILQSIYRESGVPMRQRIAAALKESARYEWIVNVCGPDEKMKLSEMSDFDWQLLQKSLSASSSWDEIWKLIPVMPASSARKFLQRLQQVSWSPKEKDDKERFERLMNLSKRLSTDHPPIWGDAELWKVIDIGGPIFSQLHGGAEMWESRFTFSHDGSEFFMLDKDGDVRTWGLPSCLPGRLHLDRGMKPLSAISASPKQPVIALAELGGHVWLCDLEGRRVFNKLIHECKPGEEGPSRISNLRFSKSGTYLLAALKSQGKWNCCNSLTWLSPSWQKAPFFVPPHAVLSPDDQWMLYKDLTQMHLERLGPSRVRTASMSASFRSGAMEFLPDSSGVIRRDLGRINLLSVPELQRVQSVVGSGDFSLMLSERGGQRFAGLSTRDYTWTFMDCPSKEQIKEQEHYVYEGRSPSWKRHDTPSHRQALVDAGVDVSVVDDFHGTPVPYTIYQLLKDPDSQYFAAVHPSGKVSFWTSTLFKYAQKPAALMNEDELAGISARLGSKLISEAELNWLRFILELAGSYEHCAIAISEPGGNSYLEFSKFDIEIA